MRTGGPYPEEANDVYGIAMRNLDVYIDDLDNVGSDDWVMILYVLCKIFRRFYTDTEWDFCQKLRSTIGYILTEFFTYILKRNINTGKICNQSVKQLTSSGCILSNKLITYSKVTPEELTGRWAESHRT